MKIMEFIYSMLVNKNSKNKRAIKGCTEEDIRKLENVLNVELPIVFKQYLLVFGRTHEDIISYVIKFPYLTSVQEEAIQKLSEFDNEFKDHMDIIIIDLVYSQQGIYLLYLKDISYYDDPPVYEFMEGVSPQSYRISNSFSSFIIERILRKWGKKI
ncbi:MAG: hypothetical protein GF364_05725 [Candidatus Lokiarchaeota archaeon]|nr:hypothetical protein [Candidatus Lokiarchaeota archaeon]